MNPTVWGSPTLQSGGQNRWWHTNGWIRYITSTVWGVPDAFERGTKSEMAHTWAWWLHNPCRLWGVQRFTAGEEIRIGTQFGCGRMHRRATTGHSQNASIFVHFAQLHGDGTRLCGLLGGPSGKLSASGCKGGTENCVPEPVWGAVGCAQRTGRGGGPKLVLGPAKDCALACIRRGGPHMASGYGPLNIARQFVPASSCCATTCMLTCGCCFW